MGARLDWRGDQVVAKVMRATKDAIDEVTKASAEDANQDPEWVSKHSGREGAIDNESARVVGKSASGKFGLTRRKGKPFDLFLAFGSNFLRPAADRNFPKLAAAIKRRV